MRYFTADSHFSFDDEEVISRDYRPFKTLKEMNEKIIEIWNSQTTKYDVIYHLGDFVNYNYKDNKHFDECFKFVNKLNAKVILICGNNEDKIIISEFNNDREKFKKYLLDLGFYEVIFGGIDLEIGDNLFYLTHCPIDHKENVENLFGHIHKTGFVKRYGFNVGVDNHYFKLFSENDILELVKRRKYFDANVYD